MSSRSHYLFIGAGGIGAYYGARLQQAGHEVSYLARGAHLRALQQHGLKVIHPEFAFDAPVDALALDELLTQHKVGDFTLLVLTVKAGATAQLLDELGTWLIDGDATATLPPMLSLQNGVDNEALIAATLGRARTLGGLAVRIGGHVVEPGLIEATGAAQIVLGAWPQLTATPQLATFVDQISGQFNAAGIPTQASADIHYELWKKLLINNGVNPLSALTELDTKALSNHPELGISVRELMVEAARAARADQVNISTADIDAMLSLIQSFDAIKTSMLVDMEKGRSLELDEIAGAVIERCKRLGEPAPITRLIDALLRNKLRRRAADPTSG